MTSAIACRSGWPARGRTNKPVGSSASSRARATPRTLTATSLRNSTINRAISGRADNTARWSKRNRAEGTASTSAAASRMFAKHAAIAQRSDTEPSCRARSARSGSSSRQAPCAIWRSRSLRQTRTLSRSRQLGATPQRPCRAMPRSETRVIGRDECPLPRLQRRPPAEACPARLSCRAGSGPHR